MMKPISENLSPVNYHYNEESGILKLFGGYQFAWLFIDIPEAEIENERFDQAGEAYLAVKPANQLRVSIYSYPSPSSPIDAPRTPVMNLEINPIEKQKPQTSQEKLSHPPSNSSKKVPLAEAPLSIEPVSKATTVALDETEVNSELHDKMHEILSSMEPIALAQTLQELDSLFKIVPYSADYNEYYRNLKRLLEKYKKNGKTSISPLLIIVYQELVTKFETNQPPKRKHAYLDDKLKEIDSSFLSSLKIVSKILLQMVKAKFPADQAQTQLNSLKKTIQNIITEKAEENKTVSLVETKYKNHDATLLEISILASFKQSITAVKLVDTAGKVVNCQKISTNVWVATTTTLNSNESLSIVATTGLFEDEDGVRHPIEEELGIILPVKFTRLLKSKIELDLQRKKISLESSSNEVRHYLENLLSQHWVHAGQCEHIVQNKNQYARFLFQTLFTKPS